MSQMKVAYITGGSKGIGLGICEALVKSQYKVAFTSRNQSDIDNAVRHLNQFSSGNVLGIKTDVRNLEEQKAAINQIVNKWGRVDVVIANAGIGHFASIESITSSQWQDVIDTNLTGAFYSIKASVDQLKETQGYYITIASLAGVNFFNHGSAYNASKFGLVGFTQAVMLDLRKYGIKVTTIMPGSVATYFNDHVPSDEDAWKIQPEDIDQMVVDLLKMHPRTLPSKIEVRPTMPVGA